MEQGKSPHVVITVTVREAYLHCAKAIMRAKLWKTEAQVERSTLPSMGQMLRDQTGGAVAAESQETMVERYRTQLY